MSVKKALDRDGYRWEFQRDGQRHVGYEKTEKAALAAEEDRKYELRQAQDHPRAGKRGFLCPTISEWAGVYFTEIETDIKRDKTKSDAQKATKLKDLKMNLTVALRFWGTKPAKKEDAPERKNRNDGTKDLRPYHDLRLNDPIDEIQWLPKFDRHLQARGLANQSINNLRYAMSNLYNHALRLEHRERTGIVVNPFKGLEKKPARRRTRVFTLEELAIIGANGATHLKLSIKIAMLAYALRHKEVLNLRTDHLDRDLTIITLLHHKSSGADQLPKKIPISPELREVLRSALADPTRNPDCPYIIQYQGAGGLKDGIKTHIGRALKAACERAGIEYGIQGQGVTFHTIRHTMGTLAAKAGIDRETRRLMSGHRTYAASDWYAHAHGEPHRDALAAFNAQIAAALEKASEKVGSYTRVTPKVTPKPVLRFAASRGSRR